MSVNAEFHFQTRTGMDPDVGRDPGVLHHDHIRNLHASLRRESILFGVVALVLIGIAVYLIIRLASAHPPMPLPQRTGEYAGNSFGINRLVPGPQSVSFTIGGGKPYSLSVDEPLTVGEYPPSHSTSCGVATACASYGSGFASGTLSNIPTGIHTLYAGRIINGRIAGPILSRSFLISDIEGTWVLATDPDGPTVINVSARSIGSQLSECANPTPTGIPAGTNVNSSTYPMRYTWVSSASADVSASNLISFYPSDGSSNKALIKRESYQACA